MGRRRRHRTEALSIAEQVELLIGPAILTDETTGERREQPSVFGSDARRREAWQEHADEIRALTRNGEPWAARRYGWPKEEAA